MMQNDHAPRPVPSACVPPVYVALDFPTARQACELAARLGDQGTHYKVGLQLFLEAGRPFVEELVNSGKDVFLDLKLHDIPNTVYGAAAAAAGMGVRLLTVHAQGGGSMVQAAVAAASAQGGGIGVLAVTMLTSLSDADVRSLGFDERTMSERVALLASFAAQAGAHGVVCSAFEIAAVRAAAAGLATLVPGIRPVGGAAADQARVATPADAVSRGADYLVVGRPITQAADPAQALANIRGEVFRAAGAISG